MRGEMRGEMRGAGARNAKLALSRVNSYQGGIGLLLTIDVNNYIASSGRLTSQLPRP